ncbi:MAG: cytochrome c [Acidobacteria bacterium]|nr:cytochrome c [Acidobacteriota bacterium]
MKHSLAAAFLAAGTAWAASELPAAKVTFTRDVAPILYKRCAECHRPGEVAPMALLTYQQARPWAKAIREKVITRSMPPWLADPRYGDFENDRRLSQKEIDTVVAWVDAGAPKGEDRDLPPSPKFEEGWVLGKPDMVVRLVDEVEVPAEGVIPYKYLTVPAGFTEDRWVQAAEIRPGTRTVVHHIIVNVREPGAAGPDGRGFKLAGFAPGEQPKVFPKGTAKLVKAGSDFVFQMHYTPNGKPAKDRSYIGLYFAKDPVHSKALTGTALNAKFVIPAGASSHEVTSSWTAKEDVRIIDLMPHMHLRGKDFTYTAVYPDGRSQVVLQVPRYDFNWQLLYRFREPLFLPAGSRLDCVAHFDNSPNNRYNPDPAKEVKWGPQTWEEMMIGWFDYTVDSQKIASR